MHYFIYDKLLSYWLFYQKFLSRKGRRYRIDSYARQAHKYQLRNNMWRRGHTFLTSKLLQRPPSSLSAQQHHFKKPVIIKREWSARIRSAPHRCLSMGTFILNFFLSCMHIPAYWIVIPLSPSTFFTPSRWHSTSSSCSIQACSIDSIIIISM